MDAELEREIRALLEKGQKIEAIRLYREKTGAGLAQAKEAVEAIERGEPTARAIASSDLEARLLSLLQEGMKIEAIKVYREETGAKLKEAKDYVEALAARHGIAAPTRTGCLIFILVGLCVLTYLVAPTF